MSWYGIGQLHAGVVCIDAACHCSWAYTISGSTIIYTIRGEDALVIPQRQTGLYLVCTLRLAGSEHVSCSYTRERWRRFRLVWTFPKPRVYAQHSPPVRTLIASCTQTRPPFPPVIFHERVLALASRSASVYPRLAAPLHISTDYANNFPSSEFSASSSNLSKPKYCI